jgi:hypothetical protein
MTPLLIGLLSAALLAGVLLGWGGRRFFERQEQLEKKVAELDEIVKRRRLPYPAQAGLEDAIAIAIGMLDDYQVQRAQDETRLGQLADRLRKVRSDPQGYDTRQPERGNGRKAQ